MVFLTGYNGFIGSNLRGYFADRKIGYYTRKIDIRNPLPASVIKKGTRTIVNLAGYIPKGSYELDENEKCLAVNLIGMLNLIDAAVLAGVKKIIQVSTIMVYERKSRGKIAEVSKTKPDTFYGLTKLYADKLLQQKAEENRFKYISLRLGFVYGTGMDREYQFGHWLKSAFSGKKLSLFGNKKEYRDYIYVDDVVKSITKAINCEESGIYNIGTGVKYTSECLAKTINREIADNRIEIVDKTENAINIGYVFNIQKAVKCLGFKPEYDLCKGLRELKQINKTRNTS
ncbi:NAD-dependent epimerase/dehydratase family protein [Candidatus Woesearchaeota archaeon]|nr:NAD-dependent epimerase/dehydratase family protein [Candidatus Woesearchaeota archaeon]